MRVSIPTPQGEEKIRVDRRERPGVFKNLIGLICLTLLVISIYNIAAVFPGSSLPKISTLEWLEHSEGVDSFLRAVIPDSVIEQIEQL